MTRILLTLATFSLVLLGATLVLGLSVGNLYDAPGAETLRWATWHRLAGIDCHSTMTLADFRPLIESLSISSQSASTSPLC